MFFVLEPTLTSFWLHLLSFSNIFFAHNLADSLFMLKQGVALTLFLEQKLKIETFSLNNYGPKG